MYYYQILVESEKDQLGKISKENLCGYCEELIQQEICVKTLWVKLAHKYIDARDEINTS